MSMEEGNGKRRIWEFQQFTICRILGLSFDGRMLKSIFKELKLNHDNQFSADFEMHQSLAQICRTQSQPAKRVEKMLEKQDKTIDAIDRSKEEMVTEISSLRDDLRSYMDYKFAKIEHEVEAIKAKIGMI